MHARVRPGAQDATVRLSFDAELSVVSGVRRPECELWEVFDRVFE